MYLIATFDYTRLWRYFHIKLARILEFDHESFMIVNKEGKTITRDEISNETGLSLPMNLDQFLSGVHIQQVKEILGRLSFVNDFNQFKILPPIIDSFKIICLAFNYIDQPSWLRFGKNPPSEPIIYLKPRTSLIGPTDDILCPKFVKQLDYEGELALVIGKKCRKVTKFNALEYVSGYALNDVSTRDLQFTDKQYTQAKGFDTFGPCGPYLTTSDEIPDPCNLHITTRVILY